MENEEESQDQKDVEELKRLKQEQKTSKEKLADWEPGRGLTNNNAGMPTNVRRKIC